MKTSAALFLAVGAFGIGVLADRLLFHGNEVCKVEAPAAPAVRAEPAPAPSQELERSDSRLAITPQSAPQSEPAALPAAAPAPKASIQARPPAADPRDLPEANLAELRQKRRAIQELIDVQADPIIQQRFDDGLFDQISEEDWVGGDDEWPRATIFGVKVRSTVTTWNRTILPREQYPELYLYHDENVRLSKLIEAAEEEELDRQAAAAHR
jgi:hypothetical protein